MKRLVLCLLVFLLTTSLALAAAPTPETTPSGTQEKKPAAAQIKKPAAPQEKKPAASQEKKATAIQEKKATTTQEKKPATTPPAKPAAAAPAAPVRAPETKPARTPAAVPAAAQATKSGRAPVASLSKDPYLAALVIEADSGKVLFEDNADGKVYPASVLKLMDLYVILDRIEKGELRLDDMVQVTPESFKTGGSQVYLDPKEQFPVEELLYALMVQSANDAAVALATHVAGSKEGFVALMNQKAQELGMTNSTFHSVHGLPPAEGQQPDVTTARDLAILCRALAQKPETFKYTGTQSRGFRDEKFVMHNHNKLLGQVAGCDGFKTGYYQAAGFSIAATAKKGGVRIITLVMGSKDRKVRDAKAAELLAKGFTIVPPRPELAVAEAHQAAEQKLPAATPAVQPVSVPTPAVKQPEASAPAASASEAQPPAPDAKAKGKSWGPFFVGLGVGFALFLIAFVAAGIWMKKRGQSKAKYNRRS